MNERIKELAEQANARELGWAYYRGEKRQENVVALHSIDLELFAELIVRECAGLLDGEWEKEILSGSDAAGILKQHFGVEE